MSGIAKAFKAMIHTVRKKLTKKSEVLVILGYVKQSPVKGQVMKFYRNELSVGGVMLFRHTYNTSEVVALKKIDKYVWRVFTQELGVYYIVELIHDSLPADDRKVVIGNIDTTPVEGESMNITGYIRSYDLESDKVQKVVSLYNNKVWHVVDETGRLYIVENL